MSDTSCCNVEVTSHVTEDKAKPKPETRSQMQDDRHQLPETKKLKFKAKNQNIEN